MLDAYIIDRIRRERESRERRRPQIRIEVPMGPPPNHQDRDQKSERSSDESGVTIVDYGV
jgi:hypothetical protein